MASETKACGIEIKSNEVLICPLVKSGDLFTIPDLRQQRLQIRNADDQQQLQAFQRTFAKLMGDYGITQVVIRSRPQKGKFAGGAVGFKLEAAIQLIDGLQVSLIANTDIKEQLKHTPLFIDFADTGLKKFLEPAFTTVFASLSRKN
ncbi:DUF3010 family protein [bacterium SCSIO 12696]|nr:DUF3010 family protein [bacterium SCSIO 12696]